MNDFNDDLSNEDDMESRNKFEEVRVRHKHSNLYYKLPFLL